MVGDSVSASDQCSAVVFYGITPGAQQAECFYQTAVEWFKELGHPADKLGVTAPGHSGKLGSFARADAKVRRTGFEAVTYFEIISSTPDAVTGHDYYLVASYKGNVQKAYADIVARSSLATLTSKSLLPIARAMAQSMRPEYGIGYTRSHELGPELYGIGINFGGDHDNSGEAYEQAVQVSRWGDTAMYDQVWRDGIVRDVYPWNFLNQTQQNRQVGELPLKEWIRRDPRRGKISDFSEGLSLWEVRDSNIAGVRAVLLEAGLIFHWDRNA